MLCTRLKKGRMRAMKRFILWSCLVSCVALAGASTWSAAATPAASPAPSDSLRLLVDRWVASVGGAQALANLHGMHLRGRAVLGGVPSALEIWITRSGMREVTVEDSGRAELVRHESAVWI